MSKNCLILRPTFRPSYVSHLTLLNEYLPPITSQVRIKVEPSLKGSNTPKIKLSVISLDPSLWTVLETASPFSLRITDDWGGTANRKKEDQSNFHVTQ